MRIEQSGAITKVWIDDAVSGTEIKLMLTSDRHHDSIQCNRDLEERHLKEAKKIDALIIDAGDLFDAMQGRFDPRRSYNELRPEYRVPHYYDAIVDDAAEFYKPYAKNFLLVGKGNHETAVLRNANIDLTSRLTYKLNSETSSNIQTGGYGGWVVFKIRHKSSGGSVSFRIKYFHGGGGDSPVTRGMIDTNRQAVYLPDADIVLNGHNHHNYITAIRRERITNMDVLKTDLIHFARTPGYKDDYGDGSNGWAVEKRMVPKANGCIWATIKYEAVGKSYRVRCALQEDLE